MEKINIAEIEEIRESVFFNRVKKEITGKQIVAVANGKEYQIDDITLNVIKMTWFKMDKSNVV